MSVAKIKWLSVRIRGLFQCLGLRGILINPSTNSIDEFLRVGGKSSVCLSECVYIGVNYIYTVSMSVKFYIRKYRVTRQLPEQPCENIFGIEPSSSITRLYLWCFAKAHICSINSSFVGISFFFV